MKLSEPQDLLVQKMKGGAELQHHLDSGLFRLRDAITTRTVHPATVESLVRSGVIIKSLDGSCRLALKESTMQSAMYLTDDRDLPLEDQRSLVIFPGGNGDWYVQVAPHHGRTTEGVRLCTSGGASSQCPGLTVAIAEAYRAMLAAQNGEKREPKPSYSDLEREVAAWRAKAARYMYDQRSDEIVLRECEES